MDLDMKPGQRVTYFYRKPGNFQCSPAQRITGTIDKVGKVRVWVNLDDGTRRSVYIENIEVINEAK